jgi:hypothetical protein
MYMYMLIMYMYMSFLLSFDQWIDTILQCLQKTRR